MKIEDEDLMACVKRVTVIGGTCMGIILPQVDLKVQDCKKGDAVMVFWKKIPDKGSPYPGIMTDEENQN